MEAPFRIQVSQRAALQMHNGFNWYENQKEGLGNEFMEEIDVCLQQIAVQPTVFSWLNTKFRRAKLPQFPYVIIYQVRGAVVLIAAVRHTRQKPMKRYGA